MSFSDKKDASEAIINIGALCLDRFQENVKGYPPNHCDYLQLSQLQSEMKDNADVHSVIMKDGTTLKIWAGSNWKWSASRLVRRLPYDITEPFANKKHPVMEYCKANNYESYKDCAIALLPSSFYKIRKNTEKYLS